MTDIISVEAAMQLENNQSCKGCLHVTVIEKGPIKTYKDNKTVCEVVVADKETCVRLQVYDENKAILFVPGTGVLISDFIVKPGFLVVTRMTEVFTSTTVTIPEEVKKRGSDLMGHIMTVNEAATSPKKTPVRSVEGVIVKASPPQIKRKRSTQEEILLRRAKLRDETGTIEVCMWRDLAKSKLEVGDHVRLSDFEVTDCLDGQNKTTPAICNKNSQSAVEMLPETDRFSHLLDLPEDLMDDDAPEVPPTTILGFGPLNVYMSCPNKSCYNKKVNSYFKCPKCNVTYSEQTVGRSVNGTMRVANSSFTMHFFNEQAEMLRDQLQVDSEITDTNFVTEICKKLPISVVLTTKDTKVIKVKVIPA